MQIKPYIISPLSKYPIKFFLLIVGWFMPHGSVKPTNHRNGKMTLCFLTEKLCVASTDNLQAITSRNLWLGKSRNI